MELPVLLRQAIENEAAGKKLSALSAQAAALSRRYQLESGNGKALVTTDEEALTYSLMRMPATFGAVFSALAYAKDLWDFPVRSLLDVGAGTGAAAWAACALFPLEQITCLEREPAMAKLGQSFMAQAAPPLQDACWISADLTDPGAFSQSADLVTASYVLNEMDPAQRERVLAGLWAQTRKLLVLVEPGTPEGFRQLGEARDLLLSWGGHLIAPCPHAQSCPLPPEDWCHFTCRISRSRIHRQVKGADAPYEDEKFCYLAFGREPVSPASSRVLRHPKIEAGKISLSLCTPGGLRAVDVRKKDGAAFKAARKADCGDDFPFSL